MPNVSVIVEESELSLLIGQWDALPKPSPMQSAAWLMPWWQAFRGPHDSLHVMVVRDEQELLGLVPCYRRDGFASGTTLRFLGDGRACSDFQSILCQPGHEAAVLDALIGWLTSSSEARWDLLDLEGVCESDPVMQTFVSAMRDRGHVTHSRQTLNTWRLLLDGSMDGLYSHLSKTQRAQFRNFLNRFDKGPYALRVASANENSIDHCIDETMRLHQLQWTNQGEPGCFATPQFRTFFQTTFRQMIADGRAVNAVLEREGKSVAALAWMVQGTVGFGYQCGRDPAEDENKVGRIVQAVGLRWCVEQGYTAFDFLRGDEEYKRQLRAVPTACNRLRIVARARLPELRHALWATCREVKSLLAKRS